MLKNRDNIMHFNCIIIVVLNYHTILLQALYLDRFIASNDEKIFKPFKSVLTKVFLVIDLLYLYNLELFTVICTKIDMEIHKTLISMSI